MTKTELLLTLDTQRNKSWHTLLSLFALLLVLAAIRPLALPDEGRYGEIGLWMLQSGDWLVPRINGIPFFHKPPLTYWFEATSMAVFGANEWALRLVSAFHAGLMLLTAYLTTRTVFTEAVAYRVILIFGTSLTFLAGGQYINHDMVVAAWITVAISSFAMAFRGRDGPHINLARCGFIACALGVLSKGLIGIALPGMVLLIWLIWTRQLGKIRNLPWVSGVSLFGLIALPWFVITAQQFPEMLAYLFGVQQFSRYTSLTFNNLMPWWFYIVALLVLLFPWALFAVYQAKEQIIETRKKFPKIPKIPQVKFRSHLNDDEVDIKNWLTLCWIWLISICIFFSIPNTKVIGYVIPIVPPLALLAALGYEAYMQKRPRKNKIFLYITSLNVCLALALTLGLALDKHQSSSRDIAQTITNQTRPSDTIYTLGGYPYDLPFYLKSIHPLIIIEDWTMVKNASSDNWKNELHDGSQFDAQAAKVLQTPDVLRTAAVLPNSWLVAPKSLLNSPRLQDWKLVQTGQAWLLYQSTASKY